MKNNKTILITGANGFIASYIAKRFYEDSFTVYGVSSSKNINVKYYKKIYNAFLGESLKKKIEEDNIKIGMVLHTAYTENKNDYEKNYTGTIKWANELKELGISKQIFLSSISARENSPTEYGKIKYKTDLWFLNNGFTVLRLGLVIGKGGMLGKIISIIKNNKIIPVIGGNKFKVHITSLDSIYCASKKVYENNLKKRLFYLHEPNSYHNKEFLQLLSKVLGEKRLFVNIPYSVALLLVYVLTFLKIEIPSNININNIKGLKYNSKFNEKSDLKILSCPHIKELKNLLNKYILEKEL